MTELNDKLITYGNLSTFYDKLQEQGLGGNAIEDVSVLPDASENKDKLFRLSSDDNVYVSELKSRTSTTTNRLPDEQQIDKAYLYESSDDIYYYKGAYKIVCSDGEIDGYLWGEYIVSLKNAESITQDSGTVYYVSDGVFDNVNKTITFDTDLASYKSENEDTNGFTSVGVTLIYATYNAPESAQIGNATIDDYDAFVTCTYNGTPVRLSSYDGSDVVEGYEWRDGGDLLVSTKHASDIFFLTDSDDNYIGDTGFYFISTNNLEEYFTYDSTTNTYTLDDESYRLSDYDMIRKGSLRNIYIPQLNAPDSEQVGVAYIDIDGERYVYKGEIIGHFLNNTTLTLYQWYNPDMIEYTTTPASNIFGKVYASTEDSLGLYYDSESDMYVSTDYTAEDALSSRFSKIGGFNTVKYQRTETTEEWDWQPLTDNATNDDIDAMFESSSPVVKRVLMKAKYDSETGELKYPLSLGEGLVNENDETMEWDGQTYYKWTLYEEDNGVSSIDYSCMGEQMIYLTTTLNPSLPFDRYSSECAYVITDGEDGYNGGAKVYTKIALIHQDGSITYEE